MNQNCTWNKQAVYKLQTRLGPSCSYCNSLSESNWEKDSMHSWVCNPSFPRLASFVCWLLSQQHTFAFEHIIIVDLSTSILYRFVRCIQIRKTSVIEESLHTNKTCQFDYHCGRVLISTVDTRWGVFNNHESRHLVVWGRGKGRPQKCVLCGDWYNENRRELNDRHVLFNLQISSISFWVLRQFHGKTYSNLS